MDKDHAPNFVLMLTMGPMQANFRVYSEKNISDLAFEINEESKSGRIRLPDPVDGSEVIVLLPANVPAVLKLVIQEVFEQAQMAARRAQTPSGKPLLVG